MTFVDIGAHIGEYTLLASRAVRSRGQVHAFEPVHELFTLLMQTLTSNRASNVMVSRVRSSEHKRHDQLRSSRGAGLLFYSARSLVRKTEGPAYQSRDRSLSGLLLQATGGCATPH